MSGRTLSAFLAVVWATTVCGQLILPPPPSINATGYVLMDAATQTILIEKNSHERLPPASLTKIMTSYIAAAEIDAGAVSLDDEVPVSENAWRAIGSRMFINPNSFVSMSDLLRGIIVQSGNDASIAVAEYIAGSEDQFAVMMNQTAEKLGLEDSSFANSTGLPEPNQYVSAHDIAILSDALIRDYPEHYAMYAEREFEYNDIKQPNRNRMLFLDPSVDGVKTGYTEEAGYCLAVSALRDGMRLISVVMGTESVAARNQETRKLLSYGFRNYQTRTIYEKGTPVDDIRVWYGLEEKLSIGVGEELTKTMFKRMFDHVATELDTPETLEAPIAAGQEIGTMKVTADGKEVATVSLIALHDVAEKGVLGRLWDSIYLLFDGRRTPAP